MLCCVASKLANSVKRMLKRLEPSRYWVWTAIEPESKLLLAMDVGERTLAMAQRVVHHVVHVLAPGCVPLCLTDGFREYRTALLTHFGHWVQLSRRQAPGPSPKPEDRQIKRPFPPPACVHPVRESAHTPPAAHPVAHSPPPAVPPAHSRPAAATWPRQGRQPDLGLPGGLMQTLRRTWATYGTHLMPDCTRLVQDDRRPCLDCGPPALHASRNMKRMHCLIQGRYPGGPFSPLPCSSAFRPFSSLTVLYVDQATMICLHPSQEDMQCGEKQKKTRRGNRMSRRGNRSFIQCTYV